MTKNTKRQSQARAADPEAVRATVYFSPELHESMRLATVEERRKKASEREPGPRTYERVTLSAVIIKACELFIGKVYPQFGMRPKRRKAA